MLSTKLERKSQNNTFTASSLWNFKSIRQLLHYLWIYFARLHITIISKKLKIEASDSIYGKKNKNIYVTAFLVGNLIHVGAWAHYVKFLACFERKNISSYASVLVRVGFSSIFTTKIENIKILELLRLLWKFKGKFTSAARAQRYT